MLAITLTFVKDIADKDTSRTLLEVAWGLYVVAVLFGVFTLMTLTGNLERPHEQGKDSIYSRNIAICAIVQSGAFILALIFTVSFGIKAA